MRFTINQGIITLLYVMFPLSLWAPQIISYHNIMQFGPSIIEELTEQRRIFLLGLPQLLWLIPTG